MIKLIIYGLLQLTGLYIAYLAGRRALRGPRMLLDERLGLIAQSRLCIHCHLICNPNAYYDEYKAIYDGKNWSHVTCNKKFLESA